MPLSSVLHLADLNGKVCSIIQKETNQSADRLGKFDSPIADRAMFHADLPADPGSWVFSKDKAAEGFSLELAGKEKQLRYSAAVTNVTD